MRSGERVSDGGFERDQKTASGVSVYPPPAFVSVYSAPSKSKCSDPEHSEGAAISSILGNASDLSPRTSQTRMLYIVAAATSFTGPAMSKVVASRVAAPQMFTVNLITPDGTSTVRCRPAGTAETFAHNQHGCATRMRGCGRGPMTTVGAPSSSRDGLPSPYPVSPCP